MDMQSLNELFPNVPKEMGVIPVDQPNLTHGLATAVDRLAQIHKTLNTTLAVVPYGAALEHSINLRDHLNMAFQQPRALWQMLRQSSGTVVSIDRVVRAARREIARHRSQAPEIPNRFEVVDVPVHVVTHALKGANESGHPLSRLCTHLANDSATSDLVAIIRSNVCGAATAIMETHQAWRDAGLHAEAPRTSALLLRIASEAAEAVGLQWSQTVTNSTTPSIARAMSILPPPRSENISYGRATSFVSRP
jgi:hypothetical protein